MFQEIYEKRRKFSQAIFVSARIGPKAHGATFPESQTVAAGQPARVFFVETSAHRPPTSDQLTLNQQ